MKLSIATIIQMLKDKTKASASTDTEENQNKEKEEISAILKEFLACPNVGVPQDFVLPKTVGSSFDSEIES